MIYGIVLYSITCSLC